MAELPPEMARLLEDARRAHEPSDADCERVRRGLYTALGAHTALGHAGASNGATGSASSGTLGSLAGTTGGKLLLVAALMGGAGGIWSWSSRIERQPAPSTSAAERAALAPTPSVTPLPVEPARGQLGRSAERDASSAGEPAAVIVAVAAERPAARVARPERAPRAVRAAAARTPVRAPALEQAPEQPAAAIVRAGEPGHPAEHVTSARITASSEVPREIVKEESEVTLIRAAFASLNAHDPQRTLELLDAHAARYPIGAMGRERAGLRVLALCDVGRVQEGRREQAAFLQAASDSPLQNRVRGACGTSAEASARDGRESR
jgi:hypothetical protein